MSYHNISYDAVNACMRLKQQYFFQTTFQHLQQPHYTVFREANLAFQNCAYQVKYVQILGYFLRGKKKKKETFSNSVIFLSLFYREEKKKVTVKLLEFCLCV